jgi:hypothetical protein
VLVANQRCACACTTPQDSATLIFKAQAEVAFREQTAGHNALLLFVHLNLAMLEQQLSNAFKELRVKQAEVGVRAALPASSAPACGAAAHAVMVACACLAPGVGSKSGARSAWCLHQGLAGVDLLHMRHTHCVALLSPPARQA